MLCHLIQASQFITNYVKFLFAATSAKIALAGLIFTIVCLGDEKIFSQDQEKHQGMF